MTEFIRNTPELIIALIAVITLLVFRLGFLGMNYDDAMRKEYPNYKGYTSFRISYILGVMIQLFPLKTTNKATIDKHVNRYNKILFYLWFFIFLALMFLFIQNT